MTTVPLTWCAAPHHASLSSAQFTSLSAKAATENCLANVAASDMPRQLGMASVASTTTPVLGSITPAAEMPTPTIARSTTTEASCCMDASTAAPPRAASVAQVSARTNAPARSINAVRILVPPTSMARQISLMVRTRATPATWRRCFLALLARCFCRASRIANCAAPIFLDTAFDGNPVLTRRSRQFALCCTDPG